MGNEPRPLLPLPFPFYYAIFIHKHRSLLSVSSRKFCNLREVNFTTLMSIENLKNFDPFADVKSGSSLSDQGLIHVRIQQRNGRKTLTTVQGLSDELDLKKIVKACKKEFACNGTVVEHSEYGEVIQLQGDQRTKIVDWLAANGIAKKSQIKLHGF